VVVSGFIAYPWPAMQPTTPPIGHDSSGNPAPGELELVRAFLSLHDHRRPDESLPPSPATVEAWFRRSELVSPTERMTARDLREALDVIAGLRAGIDGPGFNVDVLDAAAERAGLRPRFGRGVLEPIAGGPRGAIGRLLAIAFLAQRDGGWERLRRCSADDCTAIFYDRSKNRSGRWCSMQSCGNRAKVRAFRQRERGTRP